MHKNAKPTWTINYGISGTRSSIISFLMEKPEDRRPCQIWLLWGLYYSFHEGTGTQERLRGRREPTATATANANAGARRSVGHARRGTSSETSATCAGRKKSPESPNNPRSFLSDDHGQCYLSIGSPAAHYFSAETGHWIWPFD